MYSYLITEVTGAVWFVNGDFVIKPAVRYLYSDHLTLFAGMDRFFGPELSYFGALKRMNTSFIGLKLIF